MINIIVYVVSTLVTYISGLLAKKFKWNEGLPIPIQSILIALIVLMIAWLCSEPVTAEEIFSLVLSSGGGAGLATLTYDTMKIKKKGE